MTRTAQRIVYACVAAACAFRWLSPPVALAMGLAFGVLGMNPWPQKSFLLSRNLLKISIVGLGFGMATGTVLETGKTTFLYTGLGIALAMLAGILFGRLLSVPFNPAFLISAGTAICGGSAIAAVCPILDAGEEETAVSFSTIFVLNSVGLLLFPWVGGHLGLSQTQFGLWAALAIHDTSSVVGAGLRYGPAALVIGTTVKLVRSLWIVPLVIGSAIVLRRRAKVAWPWFILWFVVASAINSLVPQAAPVWNTLAEIGKAGFTVTLFLIGSGLTGSALVRIGFRPLAMALALWAIVALVTLACILQGWIRL